MAKRGSVRRWAAAAVVLGLGVIAGAQIGAVREQRACAAEREASLARQQLRAAEAAERAWSDEQERFLRAFVSPIPEPREPWVEAWERSRREPIDPAALARWAEAVETGEAQARAAERLKSAR
jgi:hypothetical protein